MKTSIFFVLIMCICFLYCRVVIAGEAAVTVTLEIPKHKYLKSQPVFAYVYVTNSGKTVAKLMRRGKMIVKDALGTIYPSWTEGVWISDANRDTLRIQPNGTDSNHYDLVTSYGKGKQRWHNYRPRHCFDAGSYTAQAVYRMDDVEIRSNIAQFVVEEPQGSDRDAFDMLVRATDLAIAGKKKEASDTLVELVKRYPNSLYTSLSYLQHFTMYEYSTNGQEQERGYKAALALIGTKPNSEEADEALTYILVRADKVVKIPRERKELLMNLSIKYPDMKIGKRAKKVLESSYKSIDYK